MRVIPTRAGLLRRVRNLLNGRRVEKRIVAGLNIDSAKAGLAVRSPLELVAFRFDIRIKYIYARQIERGDYQEGMELYRRHLKSWNGFAERTSAAPPEKVGFDKFNDSFITLLDDVKNGSFDWQRSPVPIVDGYPVNGAHRVAACLCFNKFVPCIHVFREQGQIRVFNERFFLTLPGIDQVFIDRVNEAFLSEIEVQFGTIRP